MRSFFITVLFFFLFCGCNSRIPEPISYPYSQQKKMQAASHWDVLAADLAKRINQQLILTDNHAKAVFVKEMYGSENAASQAGETTSFHQALYDLLITNLVGYGVPTRSRADQEAIEISYKVQVVYHHSDRVRSLQPGLLTSLSAAIVVLRNAPIDLILPVVGVAADVANTSLVTSGHYEIIITTSMITDDRYFFRASDIYYINEEDFYHYQERIPKTATIRLSSKNTPVKTSL